MKNLWRIWLAMAACTAFAATDGGRGVTVVPVSATAPSGNAGLFVGVNQFNVDTALRPLNFAVNDAVAQAHLFCLELKLIPPGNCHLALAGEPTTDSTKTQLAALCQAGIARTDASKAQILRALLSLSAVGHDTADLLVVSISSHGFEERGQPYAMPSDGLRGALEDTGLSIGTVEQRLQDSRAGKRLLLIDACRERPATDTRGAEQAMSSAFRSALAAAEGQATLASCDAGQLSLENTDLGHGVFTHFLLEALRGKAVADTRGFITLGAVSDYVAGAVNDWVMRNKPNVDRSAAQRPWFKGPLDAKQIPLAVDPGVRARLGAFKAAVAQTVDALKPKINRTGSFTTAVYDRLAEALEKAEDNDTGGKLLARSQDFVSGKMDEDVFVAYLDKTLETPEQRTARLLREKIGKNRAPEVGDTKTLDLPKGVKLELVWIPPGEFMMGSNDGRDEEKPVHRVKLTKGFWMGKYEVTQEQYKAVVGSNPSGYKGLFGLFGGGRNPVEQVSWDDVVAFCRKVGARLPTEAEWEYACRAGTTTKYHSGDAVYDLAQVAWYRDNSDGKTHPVGGKPANAWGLHDMHGNVLEWCADRYGEYPNHEETNPTRAGSVGARVLRGGSWVSDPSICRSDRRGGISPDSRFLNGGFRVVVDFP